MLAVLGCDSAEVEPLQRAFSTLGVTATIVNQAEELTRVSRLVIPRVASLARSIRGLRDARMIAPLVRRLASGVPVLAIDSGFHVLLDECHCDGCHTGLGVLHGKAAPIQLGANPAARHFTLPHQGWNQISRLGPCALMTGIGADEYFYFDHSLQAEPLDQAAVLGRSNHGVDFNALCATGNIFGTQFIPERSKEAGLKLFANFLAL